MCYNFRRLSVRSPRNSGSKSCGMMQNLKADFAFVQTINEFFWNFHKTPSCDYSFTVQYTQQ